MFVAGGLLALEKYAKWKIFNYMPPLVWIYLLNMVFCTMGLFNSDAVSSAYDSLKNNLLYAMIFVMLLRCDFRKLAKLSGRMIAIFLGCSVTLAIGFIIGTPPGSAALPTWPPCRTRFPSTPARMPARSRLIPSATLYGSPF